MEVTRRSLDALPASRALAPGSIVALYVLLSFFLSLTFGFEGATGSPVPLVGILPHMLVGAFVHVPLAAGTGMALYSKRRVTSTLLLGAFWVAPAAPLAWGLHVEVLLLVVAATYVGVAIVQMIPNLVGRMSLLGPGAIWFFWCHLVS